MRGMGFGDSSDEMLSVSIGPDARWLAILTLAGVSLVDLRAVDPAGKTIVSSRAMALMIWDDQPFRWTVGRMMALPGSVEFSSDGHWLATVSLNGVVRVWDLRAPDMEHSQIKLAGREKLYPNRTPIFPGVFSNDGRWLTFYGFSDTVSRWDMSAARPEETRVEWRVPKGDVEDTWFSTDGRWQVTSGGDGMVRLWQLTDEGLLQQASKIVGRNLSEDEWRQYLADEPYCLTFEGIASDDLATKASGCKRATLLPKGGRG
jgi:WD40 repeat protein